MGTTLFKMNVRIRGSTFLKLSECTVFEDEKKKHYLIVYRKSLFEVRLFFYIVDDYCVTALSSYYTRGSNKSHTVVSFFNVRDLSIY